MHALFIEVDADESQAGCTESRLSAGLCRGSEMLGPALATG
jgi:hypothetical protein